MTWRGRVQGGVIVPEHGASLEEGSEVLIEAFPSDAKERETALDELKAKLQRASLSADRGEFLTPDQVLGRLASLRRQQRSTAP